MTLRCVFCKRIKVGNRWAYEKPDGSTTKYVACPQCIEEERKKGGLTEREVIEETFKRGF
jgi:hypothetical protein